MNKKKIDIFEYSSEIIKALSKGILITVKNENKVNSMVISWGKIGIEWNRLIFTTYVRENRFTREMLDKNPEFTVNIPLGKMNPKIFAICGSESGRNIDKVKEAELTLIDSEKISVPAIKELPITLECKVIYRQKQNLEGIPTDILEKCYPQDIDGFAVGANRDVHIMYYGEIVNAYIIEE